MKLSIPIFLAIALLLISFSFAHAEAASAASQAASPANASPAILTSTITTTDVITTVNLTGTVFYGLRAEPPEPLSVTLYAYKPGTSAMDLVMSTTTKTQPDGAFAFHDVPKPDGSVFLSSATFDGVPYHSIPSTGQPMTITVYDVTTATNHLLADQLHLIFSFTNAGELEVMEVYILTNVGTQTIVAGSDGQLNVTFPLPEGALNPDFRSGVVGEAELETQDGFWETMAVRPGGMYGVSYAFYVPYAGKTTLDQPISLPVSSVGALLPVKGNLKVESANLVDNGVSDFGGTSYHVYSGDSLRVGDQLVVNISGEPNSSAGGASQGLSGSRVGLIVGLGAFGLVLILAGVWLSRRNRFNAVEDQAGIENAEEVSLTVAETEPPADAEAVMDEIIALDDLYQAGELPETAYHERRAELKEKLRAIVENKE